MSVRFQAGVLLSLALLLARADAASLEASGGGDGGAHCHDVRGFVLPSHDVGARWSNDSSAIFLFDRAESGVSAARSWEYLQAALGVAEDKRWANLNPSEPKRILDDALARSWLGRTMLEDDLRMKQTGGRYTDPRSDTGKAYWDRLRGLSAGAGGRVSAASRFWIVPAGWTIEVGDDVVVVESIHLGVKTEAQYLSQHARGSATPSGAPEGEKEKQRLDALTLATVQPHVEKMVNEAEEYAAIRAAAQAVGVSILYRRAAIYGFHPFTLRFDREGVRDDSLPASWSPRTTWDEYVKAFREGTYNLQHVEEMPGKRIVTTYFHGGVDFESWPPPTVKPLSEETARALRSLRAEMGTRDVAADERLCGRRERSAHVADPEREDLPGFGPHGLVVENTGTVPLTVRLKGPNVFQATARPRATAQMRVPPGRYRVYLKLGDGADALYAERGSASFPATAGQHLTQRMAMGVDGPLRDVRFDSGSITAAEFATAGQPDAQSLRERVGE